MPALYGRLTKKMLSKIADVYLEWINKNIIIMFCVGNSDKTYPYPQSNYVLLYCILVVLNWLVFV